MINGNGNVRPSRSGSSSFRPSPPPDIDAELRLTLPIVMRRDQSQSTSKSRTHGGLTPTKLSPEYYHPDDGHSDFRQRQLLEMARDKLFSPKPKSKLGELRSIYEELGRERKKLECLHLQEDKKRSESNSIIVRELSTPHLKTGGSSPKFPPLLSLELQESGVNTKVEAPPVSAKLAFISPSKQETALEDQKTEKKEPDSSKRNISVEKKVRQRSVSREISHLQLVVPPRPNPPTPEPPTSRLPNAPQGSLEAELKQNEFNQISEFNRILEEEIGFLKASEKALKMFGAERRVRLQVALEDLDSVNLQMAQCSRQLEQKARENEIKMGGLIRTKQEVSDALTRIAKQESFADLAEAEGTVGGLEAKIQSVRRMRELEAESLAAQLSQWEAKVASQREARNREADIKLQEMRAQIKAIKQQNELKKTKIEKQKKKISHLKAMLADGVDRELAVLEQQHKLEGNRKLTLLRTEATHTQQLILQNREEALKVVSELERIERDFVKQATTQTAANRRAAHELQELEAENREAEKQGSNLTSRLVGLLGQKDSISMAGARLQEARKESAETQLSLLKERHREMQEKFRGAQEGLERYATLKRKMKEEWQNLREVLEGERKTNGLFLQRLDANLQAAKDLRETMRLVKNEVAKR